MGRWEIGSRAAAQERTRIPQLRFAVRTGGSAAKGMTLPKMNFDGFSVVEFSTAVPPANPDASGFVYVVSCVKGESEEIPFYVGQTTQIWGRLNRSEERRVG